MLTNVQLFFVCRHSRSKPIRNEIEFLNVEQMGRCLKREKDRSLLKWIIGFPESEVCTYNVPTEMDLSKYLENCNDICCSSQGTNRIYSVNTYLGMATANSVETMKVLLSYGLWCNLLFTPSGIATDGRDFLYIGDTFNKCIQIFYTDGNYLCPLDCNGKLELGTPEKLDWSKSEPALVVTHRVNSKCFISVLKIQIHQNSSSL